LEVALMVTATHRITTYFKLAKDEVGLTQIGSKRLGTIDALDWIIAHAPKGVITIEPGQHKTVLTVDLDKAEELGA
jgi:hypothetical protein